MMNQGHEAPAVLKSPRLLVFIAGGLGAVQALSFANKGKWGMALFFLLWFSVVFWAFAMVRRKKNWALITLAVVTAPLGLFLLGNEELKEFCCLRDPPGARKKRRTP